MKHLWEIEHPYYCNQGNYFARGNEQPTEAYESWANFLEEEGKSDMDYNLVFRWDWRRADEPDKETWGFKHDTLLIYFMGQRKGLYRWVEAHVTEADEPSVKEWLAKRWDYLTQLWEGVSPSPQETD